MVRLDNMSDFKDKNILVGVTGSISIYKSCDLIRTLVKEGANVTVVMTSNAEKFISPMTFQSISGRKVFTNMYDTDESSLAHINLADNSDLIIVCPATANFISKYASVKCDQKYDTIITSAAGAPLDGTFYQTVKGMVTPLEILKKGGNAFDAAAAITASLAVVEPYGSGLGGGGFWLLHRNLDNKQVFIDGRETAPLRSKKNMYLDKNGNVIPDMSTLGGAAVGVPGSISAIFEISTSVCPAPTLSIIMGLNPAYSKTLILFLNDLETAPVAPLEAILRI